MYLVLEWVVLETGDYIRHDPDTGMFRWYRGMLYVSPERLIYSLRLQCQL
jgi:hypothetical protein